MKSALLLKGKILVWCIAATTVIGGVAYFEQSGFADYLSVDTAKEYMAPDLYLEFGEENPDWKSGIQYDSDKYVLDLVDYNEAFAHLYYGGGDHQVEYRLRLREVDDKLVYAAKLEAYEELQEMIDDGFLSYLYEEDADENTTETSKTAAEYIELYDEYQNYLEYLEELKIEDARINEVGSVYFYRRVIIEAPVECSDISFDLDGEYDLLDGLYYDAKEYSLEILNEDDFDITRPYTYVVEYELTKDNGSVYPFYRWIAVLEENNEEMESEPGIATISTSLESGANISQSGTYTRTITSADTNTSYITVDAPYVTVHLSGSGTIGGFKLSDNVKHFVIWIESGAKVNLTSGTTSLAAISGGSNSKVFILGEGTLTITGGAAGNGGTLSTTPTSSSVITSGGAGGTGAAAAIDTKQSVSVYSTGNNITIIGGSGGSGGAGKNSYYYAQSGTSTVAMAFSYAGGGGGAGGYFNYAVGSIAGTGNSGSTSGGSATWRRHYVPGSGSSDTSAKVGGTGATGSLAGGGGAGGGFRPYYDLANNTSIVTLTYYVQTTGGAGATLTVNAKAGEIGEGYDYLAYKYPGASSLTAEWKNVVGASGGTGGTSNRVTGNVYGTVFPIVFHYNGTEFANPRGSTGAVNGGATTAGASYVGTTGTGQDFYGFSGSSADILAGPTNVVEVIESTPSKLGVSFNPAPVIDLRFYYVDEIGLESVARWAPPDAEDRNTGYEIPEGYEITKYYVTAHNGSYGIMQEFEYTPEEVNQYDIYGDFLNYCVMPEEDAVESVSYWSAYLEITDIATGETVLLSPTTVEKWRETTVEVERLDGTGAILMNLKFALQYIKTDSLRDETTVDGVAQYIIRYLDDYDHNDAIGIDADGDREALESFNIGNTHITFETDSMTTSNTNHSNRYLLEATEFDLPRDDIDKDTDDNITITFKNIRMTATTITSYGSNMIIDAENLLTFTTLQAVKATDGIVSTTLDDAYIDLQDARSFTTLNLSNGIYGPELYLGSITGGSNSYSIGNLTGANTVMLRDNATLTITSTIDLPYVDTPYNTDKNGHMIFMNSSTLILPGASSVNSIGHIEVRGASSKLNFTSTFAPGSGVDVDSIPAPLRVLGDVSINEMLTLAIDGSDAATTDWIGKDIIQFTSVDKINLSEYYISRLELGIDEETNSIEIDGLDKMRIRVTFPNKSTKEFPSYKDAVEYMEYDYTGTASTSTSLAFFVTLIDDYDILGLGGEGKASFDNIALKKFYISNAYVYFQSDKNSETGEYYTFVDDASGNNGHNDTFCLSENPAKGNMYVYLSVLDFGNVEHVYAGNISLRMGTMVYADNPLTYYGTYDMSAAKGSINSTFYVIASQTIGLDINGEIQGISLVGFNSLYAYSSSKIYLNKTTNAYNNPMYFYRASASAVYYMQGNVYEIGTMYMASSSITSNFCDPNAIVYSYGSGITRATSTSTVQRDNLVFEDPLDSINRDLYVFFDADGVAAPSLAILTDYITGDTLHSAASLRINDNIVCTGMGVAVIAPEDTLDEDIVDRVTYYGDMSKAVNFISSDTRTGEYVILFIEDYQVTTTDNSTLASFYREDVELKFSSKIIEEIAYEYEGNRYNPSSIEPQTIEVVDSLEEDPYEEYNLVKLVSTATYGQEYISLPITYATPSYFEDIVFDLADPSRCILIRGSGGGVTMGANVIATNGIIDVAGYSHSMASYYNMTTQNPYVRILEGNYRNVYGAREYNSSVTSTTTTTGITPKVYIEGGTVETVYGGSYATTFKRPSEIHINGGQVTTLIDVGGYGYGYGKLYVHKDAILPETKDYDYLYITEGVSVKMAGPLIRYNTASVSTTTSGYYPYGYIYFSADSQLELYSIPSGVTTVNTFGRIYTEGTGASLVIPKMGNGGVPFRMNASNSTAIYSTGGALTLLPAEGYEYNPNVPDTENMRFKSGDNLILFYSAASTSTSYRTQAAELSHYNNGFGPLELNGNSSTGYVYLTIGGLEQTLVEHKDQEGDVTESKKGLNLATDMDLNLEPNTVMKTLHFILQDTTVELERAYVSNSSITDTDWYENGTLPEGVVEMEITDDDTGYYRCAQVSLEIESYGLNQTAYYAHAIDDTGTAYVLLLDVHSPVYVEEPTVALSEGDYHITIPIHDPTYQEVTDEGVIEYPYYTAGIYQVAWTIGDLDGCPAEDEILENQEMELSEHVLGVIDVMSSNDSIYEVPLIIEKEILEDLDLEETVIYVYVKDNLGSTRQIAIPLAEYIIDVSIPIRVGMIAVADTENYLLAPECFVVNNGKTNIKAEVIGTNIDEENEIEFVLGKESLGANKMLLWISSEDRPYSYMYNFSDFAVANLLEEELHIGDLSPVDKEENSTYFTFKADYNANELDVTGNWNLFTMKYRFTILTD